MDRQTCTLRSLPEYLRVMRVISVIIAEITAKYVYLTKRPKILGVTLLAGVRDRKFDYSWQAKTTHSIRVTP